MHSSIRKRTFRYFLLAMVVIILCFSVFFIQYSNRDSQKRFEEDHAFILRKTAESVSQLLADISRNAYYLCCNETVADLLVNRAGYGVSAQNEQLSRAFSLQINPNPMLMQGAAVTLLLDPQYPLAKELRIPFSLARMNVSRLYDASQVLDTPWYQRAISDHTQIYAFRDEAVQQYIFFAHQQRSIYIADPRYDENMGVVLYGLPKRTMQRILGDFHNRDGSVTVLMLDDTVLFSTDEMVLGTDADACQEAVSLRNLLQGRGTPKTLEVAGRRYAVNAKQVQYGWNVLLLVPATGISQSLQSLLLMYVSVFAILLLAALVLSMLFSRRLVRPIQTLSRTMHYSLDSQTLPKVTDVPHTGDEIEALYNSYNAMVEHITRTSEQLRDTQLKALQAQINPHFVYNTLDSVICIALVEEQNDIATMVAALIKLLKYSVDFSQMTVTLSEEIDYLEQYLQIQKLRYGDNFQFINDVSEKYHQVRVAKIMLQPLVENALFHAEHQDKTLIIRIWCEEKDGRLLIHTSDNGVGADVDQLNRMLAGTAEGEYYGIGIRNVNQRIHITAGEGCGIHYERAANGGLDAVITIPLDGQ